MLAPADSHAPLLAALPDSPFWTTSRSTAELCTLYVLRRGFRLASGGVEGGVSLLGASYRHVYWVA